MADAHLQLTWDAESAMGLGNRDMSAEFMLPASRVKIFDHALTLILHTLPILLQAL